MKSIISVIVNGKLNTHK